MSQWFFFRTLDDSKKWSLPFSTWLKHQIWARFKIGPSFWTQNSGWLFGRSSGLYDFEPGPFPVNIDYIIYSIAPIGSVHLYMIFHQMMFSSVKPFNRSYLILYIYINYIYIYMCVCLIYIWYIWCRWCRDSLTESLMEWIYSFWVHCWLWHSRHGLNAMVSMVC